MAANTSARIQDDGFWAEGVIVQVLVRNNDIQPGAARLKTIPRRQPPHFRKGVSVALYLALGWGA